jgi:hypothetical protein
VLSACDRFTVSPAGASGIDAGRIAKTAGTDARPAVVVGGNVVDNIVGPARIARNSADPLEVVEAQVVAHTPSD